jgi:S-formylglutathione hydrolase FrmB
MGDYLNSIQGMQQFPYMMGQAQNPLMEQLLKAMQGPSLMTNLLTQFGGGALSGIAGLLRGPTWQERDAKGLAGRLKQQENQPLIQQGQINSLYPQLMGQITPQLNQLLGGLNRQGGLSSGQGQGEAAKYLSESLTRLLGGVNQQALFTNAQAPLQRQQLLAQLVR